MAEPIKPIPNDDIVFLRDLKALDLRILMRQHVRIIFGSVVAALVAFVLPSNPWPWWILKIAILGPAAFLGLVRFFMLNGVRQELDRRAQVSRVTRVSQTTVVDAPPVDRDEGNA